MPLRSVVLLIMVIITSTSASSVGADLGRPSVLLNAETLSHVRAEIAKDGWRRELYESTEKNAAGRLAGIKPSAERWLGRTIEIPARSGHMHHFYCDCGNRLELPEDREPRPDEGYKCPACGKVYKGDKYDAAVRWWMHNEIAIGARDLALAYAIEGNERYAEKSAEILLKYADAYPGPHTTILEGGMMYQSLCEAVWSIHLAIAYDFIHDSVVLTDEHRTKIEARLLRPVADGLVAVSTHGNWESWHLSAVGVIGYAIHDRELIDYAIRRFKGQISDELGDDGLWPESVHGYHFYPLHAFLYLAEAAWNNGTDLYNWEAKPGKSLKAMFTVPLQYMYPNMQLPAINDGSFIVELPLSQYELAYARFGDPLMGWVLKHGYERKGGGRVDLKALFYGKSLEDDFPPPEMVSINFPVLGIAALKSPGESMLTFDYGPFLGHGQLDKMGITLFANGRVLVADYGTTGYGASIMEWCVSTPAHNTVVVDGKSQARSPENKLTRFIVGGEMEVAEAETEEAYPGVLHRRSVIRAGEIFLVLDRLHSEDDHTYDWMLRCEGKLRVEAPVSTSEPLGYKYIDDKAYYAADGPFLAQWSDGDHGLSVHMLLDRACSVTEAECPAETATRKVSLLIARKTGKTAEYVSALIPYKGEPSARCSITDQLIKVERGGFTDWIKIPGLSPKSPVSTDGDFALVRTHGGEPVFAAVIGGKRVVWKGKVLLRNSGGEPYMEQTVGEQ